MHPGIKTIAVFIASCVGTALYAQPAGTPAGSAASRLNNAAQQKAGATAKGTIYNAATGKPLAGIRISMPGYSAALSDDNGAFNIPVTNLRATLVVSGEGFQTKEVALKGQPTVSVYLYEDNHNSLYNEVATPLGDKAQHKTIRSVAALQTEGSWNRGAETADGMLQGKLAGLHPIMRSGTPNAGAFLSLRGFNSIYAYNQPLVVVDGMIYDTKDYGPSQISAHYTNPLATIDMRDIESVSVVKDAVSTYGTKAANGVIYITTSHAKALATKIDAAIYSSINLAPDNLPVMQSADYRVYLAEVLKSRGWSDQMIQAQPYMNDDRSNPNYHRYHNNTNWQNQVLRNTQSRNAYLKVTGGDNIAKYSISMGYHQNAGITTNTDMTKYNVRFNGDITLSRKMTVHSNLAYTYYEQKLQNQGLNPKTNPIYLALTKAPFLNTNDVADNGAVSPNLADTDTLGVGNPAAAVSSIRNSSNVYRFFGSIMFKYQLSNAWSVASLAGITLDQVREQIFVPGKGIAADTLSNAVARRILGGQAKRLFALYNDNYVDFNKTFNRVHQLHGRAGFRFQNLKTEQSIGLGFNSPTDNFISVGTGVSILRRTGGDIGKSTWTNTYTAIDYSLNNKYFASFNMAVDGSSRFGQSIEGALKIGDYRYAVLPSLGVAWLVSSENFMSRFNQIDVLKIRASYGKTGNDDIGNYTRQQLYVSQNLLGVQGLVRGNIANPYLQWESNTKANLGVDMALLNERISLSWDVFQNKSTNLLAYEPAPTATGFQYAVTNSAAMKTHGMDFSLQARLVNTKDVKWDAGLNLSYYVNRVTALPGETAVSSYGGATVVTRVNNPAMLFFGYKTNGVYAAQAEAQAAGLSKRQANGTLVPFGAGDMRIQDFNGDGIIDQKDQQYIGNPNPDYVGGFNTRVSWKRLTLEAVVNFTKGNDVYNAVRQSLESGAGTENQLQSMVNRWRAPGQVTNIPKATFGDPMGNSSFSDRWIEDGSFLRLKLLSLSYSLPFKDGFVKNATVYAIANNLVTFTKYLGYDPEFQATESILTRGIDVGLEPQFTSVSAGLRIGL